MSTKTRQTTPHVPTQRGKGERDATTAPPAPPEHADHRVRNITLMVATAVLALGGLLVLWFGVVAGGDDPQAPTSPNTISQGSESRDFLRQQQEAPVGPEQSNEQQLPHGAR